MSAVALALGLALASSHEAWVDRAANALRSELHAKHTPCVAYEDAKPFKTCFDPWKGLELGGAAGWGTAGLSGVFGAGVRLRGARESRSKADSSWLDLHRALATTLWGEDGRVAVSATLWSSYLRRHVTEGVLLVPTHPPTKLPFPLDIALAADVVRWDRRVAQGDDWALEPLRLAVLLDPLRSASSRVHLGLGVVAAYRLRQVSGALVHDVTPLTAATLFVDLESDDGWWVLRASATAGWTFSPGAAGGVFRARGELDAARVLVAINDQPISIFVAARGAWADGGARAASEVAVTGGLRLQLLSAR